MHSAQCDSAPNQVTRIFKVGVLHLAPLGSIQEIAHDTVSEPRT